MQQPIVYRIGEFDLAVPQMQLSRGGETVKLGGRALGLLSVLAEAAGALVSRDALLDRVWPGQAIDDAVIRVHLSAARKALAELHGANTIVNEAGRGYRLVLPVSVVHAAQPERTAPAAPPSPAAPASALRHLPARLASTFGRDDVIAALVEQVGERRLITLTGPGGIGKTTVAISVAQHLEDRGVAIPCFIDLAPISDPHHVLGAISSGLGLPASGENLLALISSELSKDAILLILDNCEQVIDAAAEISEDLLRASPGLVVLVTSREPLRAEGEWVHRLGALKVPGRLDVVDPARVEDFSAIALFASRAVAANARFALTADNLTAVTEICRTLDGIPLAIEFAAGRSDAMTPDAILDGLADRFGLLNRGRRTARPRHRTLRGALDWSYGLLEPTAQAVLCGISIFRSGFDLAGAQAVTADLGLSRAALVDTLSDLAAKSLLSAPEGASAQYRLLDTTRHYGREQLLESGRLNAVSRAHATHLIAMLEGSADAWEGKAPREWLQEFIHVVEDVRAALEWGRSPHGDGELALGLLIRSSALWFHLSLANEFLSYAEAALSALGDVAAPALQAELYTTYGHALWHVRGPVDAMGTAFADALAIAERVGSEALALRALWGVWAHAILAGDYEPSLDLAETFHRRIDPTQTENLLTALHMEALSLHFMGHHERSLAKLLEVMSGDAAPERANHANHAQVDGKVAATALLMRLTWLTGHLDRAWQLALACADDAVEIDHALSICYGLAIGCIPVAIAAGQHATAEQWIAILQRQTDRHGLDHWARFVLGFRVALGAPPPLHPLTASKMQREIFAVAAGDSRAVPWFTDFAAGA